MQFNNPPGKIQNNMTTPHLNKSIGSSSSRLAFLLIALVFACLGIRQSAQAGYIVTLQQVGPNVVATGSGAINLTGLTFFTSGSVNPGLRPHILGVLGAAFIHTGPTSSGVNSYFGGTGPTSFGSNPFTRSASSGSGDMVGIAVDFFGDVHIIVPTGYVSGTFLSDSATYSGQTIATLGVTPGTYVWTWGSGANQNFTLKTLPAIPPATNLTNISTRASVQTGQNVMIG